MTTPSRQQLREWSAALTLGPLDPADPKETRYVPLADDLSISLDKVAGIQQERGQLDDALTAYTESLTLSRRILTDYGETPQSLRDLSISLNNVAGIQQERGQPDTEGFPGSRES